MPTVPTSAPPLASRRPLIDPLLLVLKSRKVIVALAALLAGIIVLAVPSLVPLHEELLTLIITLALAVIGGTTVEDAARIARTQISSPPLNEADLRLLVREVVITVLDEVEV